VNKPIHCLSRSFSAALHSRSADRDAKVAARIQPSGRHRNYAHVSFPAVGGARLQSWLKSRPDRGLRVELAFRPASKPFIFFLSRLQPTTRESCYEFFSSLSGVH
jgi:hypothetical protein